MLFIKKTLLLPFTLLYAIVIHFRNYFYDKKVLSSTKFEFPIICIGNLSTGGTGKTPHTDYLISLLKQDFNISVLSRGYKRETKGFVAVQRNATALEVGDEPLFYKLKHKEIKVAVCEDRVFGISAMALTNHTKNVYLLDDAFQHRAIKCGLNILLTDYNLRYTKDYILPLGNLREFKSGANRADIVIVTKCPSALSFTEKNQIRDELKLKTYQHLFFSEMIYNPIYSILNNGKIENEKTITALMVTGIAKPKSMLEELENRFNKVYTRVFEDHHNFTIEDIKSIIRTYKNIDSQNKALITTEKDATRLYAFKSEFIKAGIEIYCLPILVNFNEENEKVSFNQAIKHYLNITLPQEIDNVENLKIEYDQ